jgi:hypothetical protein
VSPNSSLTIGRISSNGMGTKSTRARTLSQTFWISADKNRYLVKFEAGGVSAELLSVRQRKPGGKNTFHEKGLGASVSAPADWTFWRPSTEAAGKVVLLDPSAEFDSQFEINTREQFKLDAKTSVRKWADDEVQNVFEKKLKDFKVRAESWKTLSIRADPAVSFVADFTEGKKEKSSSSTRQAGWRQVCLRRRSRQNGSVAKNV